MKKEHYSLERWNQFLLHSFPLAKGYAVGMRFFALPSESEFREWGASFGVLLLLWGICWSHFHVLLFGFFFFPFFKGKDV